MRPIEGLSARRSLQAAVNRLHLERGGRNPLCAASAAASALAGLRLVAKSPATIRRSRLASSDRSEDGRYDPAILGWRCAFDWIRGARILDRHQLGPDRVQLF